MTTRRFTVCGLIFTSLVAFPLLAQSSFGNVATRIAGAGVLFDVSYDGVETHGARLQFTYVDPNSGAIQGLLTPARSSTSYPVSGQLTRSAGMSSSYYEIRFFYDAYNGSGPFFIIFRTTHTGALRLNNDGSRTAFIAGTSETTSGFGDFGPLPFSAVGAYFP